MVRCQSLLELRLEQSGLFAKPPSYQEGLSWCLPGLPGVQGAGCAWGSQEALTALVLRLPGRF